MKPYFQSIRKPNPSSSGTKNIFITLVIVLLGFFLGIFQKWLDATPVNELPQLFTRLDITNFFGRIAVWILIATVISVYASTPANAAIRTFLFFAAMLSGYYLYSHFILGFFPKAYAAIWGVFSIASFFLAYLTWYAKGNGTMAILVSCAILGVLFAQAFFLTQGFRITHWLEVMTWCAALFVLRRKPKEFAIEFGLSVIIAFLYQLCIPYWG